MKLEVYRLIKIMTIFSVILGIIFFIIALLRGYNLMDSISLLIGVICGNVPEGLLP